MNMQIKPVTPFETVSTSETTPLAVRGLTVSYGNSPAIFSVDLTARPGTLKAIVGPNGAGKSTLLKAALGLVTPLAGHTTVFGRPLPEMREKIAYVPQRTNVDWDFPTRVIDVVLMGLYPKLGLLGRLTGADKSKARESLERVGMSDFADRQIGKLSGGQQQRVFLARALAQEAEIYLLDEPFAGVDAATEKATISVLKSLAAEGRTIVAVHHDLATVPDYFDDVLLINRSTIAEGPMGTTYTDANLAAAYGGRLATSMADTGLRTG